MDRHNLHAPANFAAFPKPRFDFGGCQSQVMSTVLSDTRLTQTDENWVTYLTTRKHKQALTKKDMKTGDWKWTEL